MYTDLCDLTTVNESVASLHTIESVCRFAVAGPNHDIWNAALMIRFRLPFPGHHPDTSRRPERLWADPYPMESCPAAHL